MATITAEQIRLGNLYAALSDALGVAPKEKDALMRQLVQEHGEADVRWMLNVLAEDLGVSLPSS